MHIHGSRRFKHHQNSTRRPPETKKKSENWSGRGQKKREILALRLRAPTLRAPTLRGPTLRAPTLGALTFSRSGPHPSGPPTLRAPVPLGSALRPPPPFERRPSGPPLFLGLGPNVPHFYHVAHLFFFCAFFNCFLFLVIFLKISLFFFLFFFFSKKKTFFLHFSFFQVGEEGGREANPNPKLVSCLGGRVATPQTSLRFGEEVTTSPNPNPPP